MSVRRSGGTSTSKPAVRDLLARTALHRELGDDGLARLLDGTARRTVERGETLVVEGAGAGAVYLLVRGALEVTTTVGGEEHPVARLKPGAVVGEIAVLAGGTRSSTVRAATRAVVVEVAASRMRELLEDHPDYAAGLVRQAAERLRSTQFLAALTVQFGPMPPGTVPVVEDLVDWITVPAGEELFAEGDAGDAAYLVLAGRLRVVRGGSGQEHEVAELGRGDLVGEIALLVDAPRNASVFAVRDTHLARFTADAYRALIERHPAAGLFIARAVLKRSQSTVEQGRGRPLSMLVVPTGECGVADDIVESLCEAMGPRARVVSSADVDAALGARGMAQVDDGTLEAGRLEYWLDELQQGDGFVILRPDDQWTTWSRRALRWADLVLLVGDAATDPAPGPFEAELHRLLARHRHPRVALALVHGADTDRPSGTRRWIDQRSLASHHHVRRGDPTTVGRLARLLDGTATALVLGGGGARGFAHLGVHAVLEEQGTDIDVIGGTSIGAVMGAVIALGWTSDHALRTAVAAFRDLFDYTVPVVSLLRGERITSRMRSFLGDMDIADLWIPFFCASTDLTTADVRFHDRGDLVRALRASIAIPGVLPPVPLDGHLLVDGGMLDNVPVEEMRRRHPTGRILAVDVAPSEGPVAHRDYGLSVAGVSALRERRRVGAAHPSVLTTMVRSSLIASVRDRDRIVREGVADLYVDLAVDGGGGLDFSSSEQIAHAGASAMRPVLRAWLDDDAEQCEVGTYARTAAVAVTSPPAPPGTARRGERRWAALGVVLLTLRDLQRRAVRFAAVIVGTAVVFTLLFLMTGLVEQFHREPRDTVASFGASGWMVRHGSSGAFTSAATMPADAADLVEGTRATPVVIARHTLEGTAQPLDVVVVGITAGGVGEPDLVDGRLAAGPTELVIDDSAGLEVGDRTSLGGREFTVTGRTDRTTMFAGMPLVFLDMGTAQELVYRGQPLATAVLLEGEPSGTPDGFATLAPDEVAEDGMRPLERSISSVSLIRVLLWFVAAMIIGTMIYLSALERRRDVAVLTAIGASGRQMGASIALQGVLTGLVAALAAAALQVFVVPVFPLEVVVPGRALVQVPLLAVIVSLAAGGIGLRTALRTDPALAFAGPGA